MKIDLNNAVTFKKYLINRNPTLSNTGLESVELGKEIGEEVHICKPEIIAELSGKAGIWIKELNGYTIDDVI